MLCSLSMLLLISHKKNHMSPSLVIEKFVPLKSTNEVFTVDAASVILIVMFKLAWAFELFATGLIHLLSTGAALSFLSPGVKTLNEVIVSLPSGYLPMLTLSNAR